MSGPLPNPSKRASRPCPGQRLSVVQQTKRPRSAPNARFNSNPTNVSASGSSPGRSHRDSSNQINSLTTHALLVTIEDINPDNEPITFVNGEI
ncbi:hypothetical protein Pyn_19530 [Prunus yedoensis var. nudiflora]|uniref:Uncharacterized protein n=1 Tax=Prunus yedoensis var. nudiflora TaxID=2094558 RepID=A0A314XPZ6_PRUYE|nr:hypothetical protein Pyn_19530 [Prunus yedoensis var. nudiflora]